MPIAFFDSSVSHTHLLPLTYLKPCCDLRVGILTIREKWEKCLSTTTTGFKTREYLSPMFRPPDLEQEVIWINGVVLPENELVRQVMSLESGQSISYNGTLIATKSSRAEIQPHNLGLEHAPEQLSWCWDIFLKNGSEIRKDYQLITSGRASCEIDDPFTQVYSNENIFIEEGASIKASLLNAENGPIYIGKNAEVHEGAIIRGPFALCENSVISMGGRMRGDITVGPFSKIGGEIGNSVIQGYTSKGHDGYLGNAVLGEWCNLGADTNNSNLKNNYKNVKMWNHETSAMMDTGLQFCGLIMGDHSKCSINTMFNTGTTVGLSASIFGGSFPPNFVPSFSWGGSEGLSTYEIDKMIDTLSFVMARRHQTPSELYIEALNHIFKATQPDRFWEKK
ncbi:MAG: GlmU family protein [Cyclobacteriaceae bacterium]